MFVHLRSHSEYSVVDGILRIDDAIEQAAKFNQPAIAITDLNNTFGALKLYKAGRSGGVKPIIGAEIYLDRPSSVLARTLNLPGDMTPTRMILLVQNDVGWRNLSEILARGWTKNADKILAQALIKWEWIKELNEGLIALSGAGAGPIEHLLLKDNLPAAYSVGKFFTECFPTRFYFEVQRIGKKDENDLLVGQIQMACELQIPVVATHPIQFLESKDFETHEARVCVSEGVELAGNRTVRFTPDQYLRSSEEMEALWHDIPSAIQNTVEIAKRCSLKLKLNDPQLPDFPTPDGSHIKDYLKTASYDGLEKRLRHLYKDEAIREVKRPIYNERLEFELKTINGMGFPGYFLIVSDFILWAKNNACPVGPGRGSGAGSLVAYALYITDLDPLQYNLLFERFLNPDRVSMPDFDIDFCQGNRDRVIDYVKDKYGHEAVSQIATFGSMAAKASLRDIGRVMGMGYGFVDSVSKLIPSPPGKSVTLQKVPAKPKKNTIYVRQECEDLMERVKNEEEVKALLEMATNVEGTVRNIGMHAGGVLIAPGKITDFCPLYMQPGSGSAVSMFDKDDVEQIGLVKFDFLGLATLTILEHARNFIKQRRPGMENFAYEDLPLDDAAVYDLFSAGRTEAVFQFESSGMQKMLRDAKPSRLEDLIALNALYRPGPMDLIPTFVARKHGREEVEYPHPLVANMLSETYGIMVYQEQVMQTAQILGGYTLGGADLLRRAMGKKKVEEMVMHRATFREGAAKNGLDQAKADEVFDLMEKFAGYGFNKSHAAAYSLLAYHTGWIKVHCTAEFFAGNLIVESDDTEKIEVLIKDAKTFGITVDAPDINKSVGLFVPTADDRIQYGLAGLKGTGAGAIENIVAEREANGPYKSIYDFTKRVDRKKCNKRVMVALIKAGAFDRLHPNRDHVFGSLENAMRWAEGNESSSSQNGLFDLIDSNVSFEKDPELITTTEWNIIDKLRAEREAIGFCISGHFFDYYRPEVSRVVKVALADIRDSEAPVWIAGVITDVRNMMTQRGTLNVVKIQDGTAEVEIAFDEKSYQQYRDFLKKDELLIVEAKIKLGKNGALRVNMVSCLNLIGLRSRFGRFMRVNCSQDKLDFKKLSALIDRTKMKKARIEDGVFGLPVRLHMTAGTYFTVIDLGDNCLVAPSDDNMQEWKKVIEPTEFCIEY